MVSSMKMISHPTQTTKSYSGSTVLFALTVIVIEKLHEIVFSTFFSTSSLVVVCGKWINGGEIRIFPVKLLTRPPAGQLDPSPDRLFRVDSCVCGLTPSLSGTGWFRGKLVTHEQKQCIGTM